VFEACREVASSIVANLLPSVIKCVQQLQLTVDISGSFLSTKLRQSSLYICVLQRAILIDSIRLSLLPHRFPELGDAEGWHSITKGFAARGFDKAGGAIDGTHFLLKQPSQTETQCAADSPWLNRKGLFSIAAQAVVDADGNFIDFMVGYPGSIYDCTISFEQT